MHDHFGLADSGDQDMSVSDSRGISPLAGRHILIVEDEMIVSMDLCDIVEALGCTSVTAGRVGKATQIAATQNFDIGILDLNLAGEAVYPVADELDRRGIAYIIASGYGADGISAAYRDRPMLFKPYSPQDVEAALLKALLPKSA